MLDQHPDIYMAKPGAPEPKFFLVDDEYRKGLEYYSQKYFAKAGGRQAVGEKSTNYLESSVAASRIREAVPAVKLVFAIRNPLERAYSNYLWSRKNGLETLSFEEAVEKEETREAQYALAHRYSRPFSYVSRGMYAELLKPYFDLFTLEQLKVVFLEEIEARTKATLDDLCRYLGVRPLPDDTVLPSRVNSARDGNEQMTERTREKLRDIYREPNRRLAELLSRDLSLWS